MLDRRVHLLAELLSELADALRNLAADLVPPLSFALTALAAGIEEDVLMIVSEPLRRAEGAG